MKHSFEFKRNLITVIIDGMVDNILFRFNPGFTIVRIHEVTCPDQRYYIRLAHD